MFPSPTTGPEFSSGFLIREAGERHLIRHARLRALEKGAGLGRRGMSDQTSRSTSRVGPRAAHGALTAATGWTWPPSTGRGSRASTRSSGSFRRSSSWRSLPGRPALAAAPSLAAAVPTRSPPPAASGERVRLLDRRRVRMCGSDNEPSAPRIVSCVPGQPRGAADVLQRDATTRFWGWSALHPQNPGVSAGYPRGFEPLD
jgi:hypothetical protein